MLRGEIITLGQTAPPPGSTEECREINRRASVSHALSHPICQSLARLPALSRPSHENALAHHHGQLLYFWEVGGNLHALTESHTATQTDDSGDKRARLICCKKEIRSVSAITFNRPGKGGLVFSWRGMRGRQGRWETLSLSPGG